MTRHTLSLRRRTALRTVAGAALASVAGCLDDPADDETSPTDGQPVLERVAVDDTAVVVDLASETDVDQINLIQPDGELYGQRDIAAGVQQVSFDIGSAYAPGEYDVVALSGDETVAEQSATIQPELHIREVGLYRNHPNKPWDDVYGDTETNRLQNGEAFVTVENTGNGPEAITELIFSGDVPNPVDNPRGSGMYETERVVLLPGETADLFSNSFPFGSESEEGMGCSLDGNSGQFVVILETRVGGDQVSNTFNVQYSESTEMSDCVVTITEG